jgi:hypothetical protein
MFATALFSVFSICSADLVDDQAHLVRRLTRRALDGARFDARLH